MTAFIHFAKTERAKLKEVMRNLTFAEASSTLGQIWNNAPEEKRKPHLDWEVKDRAIYNGKRHHGEKIIRSSARSERSELSPQNPNTSLANLITQKNGEAREFQDILLHGPFLRASASTLLQFLLHQAPCGKQSCDPPFVTRRGRLSSLAVVELLVGVIGFGFLRTMDFPQRW